MNPLQHDPVAMQTPRGRASRQKCATHSVQFYAEDRFILGAAAQFLGAALSRGEAGIVLATADHCRGIAEHLEARGIDTAQARVCGRYVEIDAAEMLSKIKVQHRLDGARFAKTMGDTIASAKAAAAEGSGNVAIFGEAVSVLAANGESAAALRLEQLWNELGHVHSFTLLCGYAAESFSRSSDAEVFAKVCAEHTHVQPEESFLQLKTGRDRLRYIARLQQKARALEAETLARRQSEEALARSEKLAVVGRLTASIAHEINNPLTSLTNLFYLMNTDTCLNPAARHYAALADQELQRTARITKQVLAFHRESTSPVPCMLAPILDGVLELYEPRLRASDVALEKQYKVEGAIEGFGAEMRQLFANLIGNAMEAMGGRKGKIVLRVSSTRDWTDPARRGVRVSIADTGSGISPEDQKRIFKPFFTTKGESGTGLGLWVCHGIVQKHRGRIRFRSRPHPHDQPGGTVFSVFLPARATSGTEDHVSAAPNGQNALRATG